MRLGKGGEQLGHDDVKFATSVNRPGLD